MSSYIYIFIYIVLSGMVFRRLDLFYLRASEQMGLNFIQIMRVEKVASW